MAALHRGGTRGTLFADSLCELFQHAGSACEAGNKTNHKETWGMSILYELEFDLDGFIESMEKQYPARRRIEEHMEKRRLREELAPFADDEDDDRRNKTGH